MQFMQILNRLSPTTRTRIDFQYRLHITPSYLPDVIAAERAVTVGTMQHKTTYRKSHYIVSFSIGLHQIVNPQYGITLSL